MTDYKTSSDKLNGRAALVAVSKFHPYEAVLEAYEQGARLFGENRVQEMREKFPPKGERPDGMKVFLIGQLQRNKVRKAVELSDRIESVDSMPLIEKIEKEVKKILSIDPDVYAYTVRVPVMFGHLETVWLETEDVKNRAAFSKTKALYDRVREIAATVDTLSMGMSADWETALEYGSTEVRIGTAIFGERDYSRK